MELRSAEVYDPISRRWSALPVMDTRRAYVGVACLSNCIYAVGGWNEALGSLETVEKYCPEEVKWDTHLPHLIHVSCRIRAAVQSPHRRAALSTGEVGRGGSDVHCSCGRVGVSCQRAAVRRRRAGRQQRLLSPGDSGLGGDLRPSPGYLDRSWQHDHQPL